MQAMEYLWNEIECLLLVALELETHTGIGLDGLRALILCGAAGLLAVFISLIFYRDYYNNTISYVIPRNSIFHIQSKYIFLKRFSSGEFLLLAFLAKVFLLFLNVAFVLQVRAFRLQLAKYCKILYSFDHVIRCTTAVFGTNQNIIFAKWYAPPKLFSSINLLLFCAVFGGVFQYISEVYRFHARRKTKLQP